MEDKSLFYIFFSFNKMSSTSSDGEEYGKPTANLYNPAPVRIEEQEDLSNTEKLKKILIREGHSYEDFMIALWKDGEDETFYEDMEDSQLEELAMAFVKAQSYKPKEEEKIPDIKVEKKELKEPEEELKKQEENKQEAKKEEEEEEEDDEEEQTLGTFMKKVKVKKLEHTELCTTEPIRVEIQKAELSKRSSFLKGKFAIYTIYTLPFKWTVQRRYSDFVWLVKCLKMRFPAHYVNQLIFLKFQIPALPPKTMKDKSGDNIMVRMGCFAYFLQILVMSKDMAYSPELEAFLSHPDLKKAKESSKLLYRVLPNPIEFSVKQTTPEIKEIETPSGELNISMDPRLRKKTRALSSLMQSVEPLEKEASKLCKTITAQMDKISDNLKRLALVSEQMGKAYKKAKIQDVSSIYDGLKDAFKSWSDVVDKDSSNFFSNIRLMFLVSRQEEAGINETIKERNQFSEEYKQKKSALLSKKEKLYPSMSLKVWDINQDEIDVSIQQILQSKDLAIKYMLPKVKK